MKFDMTPHPWEEWVSDTKEVSVVFRDSNEPETVTLLSMHHCLLKIKREHETMWINMTEIKTISQLSEYHISESELEL